MVVNITRAVTNWECKVGIYQTPFTHYFCLAKPNHIPQMFRPKLLLLSMTGPPLAVSEIHCINVYSSVLFLQDTFALQSGNHLSAVSTQALSAHAKTANHTWTSHTVLIIPRSVSPD